MTLITTPWLNIDAAGRPISSISKEMTTINNIHYNICKNKNKLSSRPQNVHCVNYDLCEVKIYELYLKNRVDGILL